MPIRHRWRLLAGGRRWRRRRPPRPQIILLIAVSTFSAVMIGCLANREIAWRRSPDHDQGPRLAGDRTIRVRLLGAGPVSRITLESTGAFAIVDAANERVLHEGRRLPVTALTPSAGSAALNLGDVALRADDVIVRPSGASLLVVDRRTYRGTLRIARAGAGLSVTNYLDIEEYLGGVLRGELPRHFHAEAHKAQAVAARTYVLYQKLTASPRRAYDVLADERSQMYIGVQGEDAVAIEAVEATRGEVCLARQGGEERLFCTYYSSCCGGVTESVADFRPTDPFVEPLGGGVRCEDCYLAPAFRWGPVKLSKAEILRKVVARYPKLSRLGRLASLAVERASPDGRVRRIRLVGSSGASEALVGEDFRLSVGGRVLKSTRFRIEDAGTAVRFVDGRGFGHGVGLCQYGADRQGKLGRRYRDILSFYYPGCIIRGVY